MSQNKQIEEVELFGEQFNAYYFNTQFGAVTSGTQSGKTFLGAHWSGKQITKFPDKDGIIIAPTYKILQHATLKKFWEIFPELRKFYKEQKGEVRLPTGGTIFIRSADNPLGIEGVTAHWWWLDEGGMSPRLVWTVLRGRVSMTGGQGLITTTWHNLGWLYLDFYIPWKEGIDKNLSVFKWRSIDNPYFPRKFYEEEKKRLSPTEFARRYEGEPTKMEGLVWELPEDQIIKPIEGITKKAEFVGAGIDWGFRNPAAIPVCALYDNAWYVIDDWKEAEKTTDEIIQVAKNNIDKSRVQRFYPDPAEPDRIEECKRAGLNMADTNKDIRGGISTIQQLIKDKRFFVFNTCKNFLDEINSYHYPEGQEGKPFKDEPEKINDHLCDGIRYCIHSYQPAKEFKVDYRQKKMIRIRKYEPKWKI